MMFVLRALFVVVICVYPLNSSVNAYQPTWKDISYLITENSKWDRILIKTNVQIFDPFFVQKGTTDSAQSSEIKSRSYHQTVYWKRDSHLGIETVDTKNQLLHIYYKTPGSLTSTSTDVNRYFSKMDIVPYYLQLITQYPKFLDRSLAEINIEGRRVSLYRSEDYKIFYRIGDSNHENYALVNKDHWYFESLHWKIPGKGNTQHSIKVQFKDFKKYRGQEYPQQTDFLINNQLFKRVTITSMSFLSSIPTTKFNRLSQKWKSLTQIANLEINYAR